VGRPAVPEHVARQSAACSDAATSQEVRNLRVSSASRGRESTRRRLCRARGSVGDPQTPGEQLRIEMAIGKETQRTQVRLLWRRRGRANESAREAGSTSSASSAYAQPVRVGLITAIMPVGVAQAGTYVFRSLQTCGTPSPATAWTIDLAAGMYANDECASGAGFGINAGPIPRATVEPSGCICRRPAFTIRRSVSGWWPDSKAPARECSQRGRLTAVEEVFFARLRSRPRQHGDEHFPSRRL